MGPRSVASRAPHPPCRDEPALGPRAKIPGVLFGGSWARKQFGPGPKYSSDRCPTPGTLQVHDKAARLMSNPAAHRSRPFVGGSAPAVLCINDSGCRPPRPTQISATPLAYPVTRHDQPSRMSLPLAARNERSESEALADATSQGKRGLGQLGDLGTTKPTRFHSNA